MNNLVGSIIPYELYSTFVSYLKYQLFYICIAMELQNNDAKTNFQI